MRLYANDMLIRKTPKSRFSQEFGMGNCGPAGGKDESKPKERICNFLNKKVYFTTKLYIAVSLIFL